jgi:hypothetical protein
LKSNIPYSFVSQEERGGGEGLVGWRRERDSPTRVARRSRSCKTFIVQTMI